MPVPKGVDPAKYDRCVDDVKEKGEAKNAYAVCAASLKSEVSWGDDMVKSIDRFNQMLIQKSVRVKMRKMVHGNPVGVSESGHDPAADKRSDAKKMY